MTGLVRTASHSSQGVLVDEGLAIFRSMVEDHHVKPQGEHCACLVDLLGHAGNGSIGMVVTPKCLRFACFAV